jgi:hypothetical protein
LPPDFSGSHFEPFGVHNVTHHREKANMNVQTTEGFLQAKRMEALGFLHIEPISIRPARFVEVLCSMSILDWPKSFLELQRLGVPRAVNGLLLDLATDQVTEQELVRAFLVHISGLRTDQVRNPWRVWITKVRLSSHLETHPLSLEEKLAILTLNTLCRKNLESWAEWAGW